MDKKRQIHNEIEKKRRIKFNDCFVGLSEVVPIFANQKKKPVIYPLINSILIIYNFFF